MATPQGPPEPELCGGCGAVADASTDFQHPIIGVTFRESEDGSAYAVPICHRCHQQPPRGLGMHFFDRRLKRVALAMAGSDTIGG